MSFSEEDASPSWMRWESACAERSFAMSSEESLAALLERVDGMIRSEAAKAPIASCSREPLKRFSQSAVE